MWTGSTSVNILTSYFSKVRLNIICIFMSKFAHWSLIGVFWFCMHLSFLPFVPYVLPISSLLIIPLIFGEQYTFWSFLLCIFLQHITSAQSFSFTLCSQTLPVYVLLLIGAQSFSPIPTDVDSDDYDDGGGGGDLSLVILSISFSLEINAVNYTLKIIATNYTILSVLCGFSMFILANQKYLNVVWYDCSFTILFLGRDIIVGIVTCYGLDNPGIESSCRPGFLHPASLALGPPSLLCSRYQVSCPGIKQPGHVVDHPPISSTEVKERVSYLYCPSGPSWPVLGWTLPSTYTSLFIYLQWLKPMYISI